jgi:apolipoprotein N-acyltransferase
MWQKQNISARLALYQDITAWVKWGDKPILGLCLILFLFSFSARRRTKKAQVELTDIAINT